MENPEPEDRTDYKDAFGDQFKALEALEKQQRAERMKKEDPELRAGFSKYLNRCLTEDTAEGGKACDVVLSIHTFNEHFSKNKVYGFFVHPR